MLTHWLDPKILALTVAGLAALLFLLLLITAFLGWRVHQLRRKLGIFFSGKNAQDLETILIEEKERVRTMDEEIQELFEISNKIHALSQRSFHKSSVMRFNPFKEVGGNQSFAVALLDGKNNGVVISSLHTGKGTRVYAKPVKAGLEDGFPLTDEEKTVIEQAKSREREKKV